MKKLSLDLKNNQKFFEGPKTQRNSTPNPQRIFKKIKTRNIEDKLSPIKTFKLHNFSSTKEVQTFFIRNKVNTLSSMKKLTIYSDTNFNKNLSLTTSPLKATDTLFSNKNSHKNIIEVIGNFKEAKNNNFNDFKLGKKTKFNKKLKNLNKNNLNHIFEIKDSLNLELQNNNIFSKLKIKGGSIPVTSLILAPKKIMQDKEIFTNRNGRNTTQNLVNSKTSSLVLNLKLNNNETNSKRFQRINQIEKEEKSPSKERFRVLKKDVSLGKKKMAFLLGGLKKQQNSKDDALKLYVRNLMVEKIKREKGLIE